MSCSEIILIGLYNYYVISSLSANDMFANYCVLFVWVTGYSREQCALGTEMFIMRIYACKEPHDGVIIKEGVRGLTDIDDLSSSWHEPNECDISEGYTVKFILTEFLELCNCF